MSADLLLREFQRITEATVAIDRLRQFILKLAVSGRLLAQDLHDGGAAQLLERIAADAAVEVGGRRTIGSVIAHQMESLPFATPDSWGWAYLTDICDVSYGYAFDSSGFRPPGTGKPLIRIRDISSTDTEAYFEGPFDARYLVHPGDILVGMDGDFNVRRWKGPEALLNQRVMRLASWKHEISSQWTTIPLQMILNHLHSSTSQTTVKHLSAKQIKGIQVPIPPLAEQRRIVSKVNEFMAICDQLDLAQKDGESYRDSLRKVSLSLLTLTDSGSDLNKDARFFLDLSPRLITKPQHVVSVRRAIVELAIRGHLLPQDSDDEISSDLLERIPEAAKGRGSTNARTFAVDSADRPFETPASWAWIRLGRLITSSDAGWSPKTENFPRSKDNWGVLKVSAVSWDEFRPEENKQLLPGVEPREVARVRQGDFLISRANTSELVAKAVIVPEEPHNLMLSDKTVRLAFVPPCNSTYLLLVNNHAQFARDYYVIEASGASPSMKNVSRDVIYQLPIPLPPLAEQHRIVSKVDALMTVCDEMETALRSTQHERGRLLEVLLHEALNEGAGSMALAEAVAEAN